MSKIKLKSCVGIVSGLIGAYLLIGLIIVPVVVRDRMGPFQYVEKKTIKGGYWRVYYTDKSTDDIHKYFISKGYRLDSETSYRKITHAHPFIYQNSVYIDGNLIYHDFRETGVLNLF